MLLLIYPLCHPQFQHNGPAQSPLTHKHTEGRAFKCCRGLKRLAQVATKTGSAVSPSCIHEVDLPAGAPQCFLPVHRPDASHVMLRGSDRPFGDTSALLEPLYIFILTQSSQIHFGWCSLSLFTAILF